MKKAILLVSLFTLMFGATPVLADGQEITQNATINCITGAYGQDTTCTVTQNGDQRIVIRHQPVNTALDTKTTAVVASTIVLGMLAIALRIKNRVA